MLFRTNPQAGLKKAEAALVAAEAKLAELADARAVALRESDDVAAVQQVDKAIDEMRAVADVHRDRIAELKRVVREQQAEETERQRQAALAEVQKRLDAQVELAKEVEAAVRQLGAKWNQLLGWRQAIIAGWPEGLPRPSASDFVDVGPLRRELGNALFAASNPRWDKIPSIPPPLAPLAVEGLSPRGIAGYVAAAGSSFLSRIRSQRIEDHNDNDEAAA